MEVREDTLYHYFDQLTVQLIDSYSVSNGFQHQTTIKPHASFISELEWTPWKQQDGKCKLFGQQTWHSVSWRLTLIRYIPYHLI